MMKKIVVAIILVLLIIGLGGVILNYNKNETKEKIEFIDNIVLEDNEYLSNLNRINERYLMTTKTQIVEDNENEPKENNEIIQLFDLKENKFLDKEISLEGSSLYVGMNNSSIYMSLMKINSNKIDLVEISYPDLKIVNITNLNTLEGISDVIVAKETNKLAYSTEEGMFICDKDLNNSKLLLKSNHDEVEDTMDFELCYPIEFIENDTKIIYIKLGYEWSCGIGIYDIDKGVDNYYETPEAYLLKYVSPNEIYTEESHAIMPIKKYNFSTKNEETVIELEDIMCLDVDISEKNDRIVYVKEIYEDQKRIVEYNVYDMNTKKVIATYLEEIGEFDVILETLFVKGDDQILIIKTDDVNKSNEIKVWNYNVK